jgi:hypothetical protein
MVQQGIFNVGVVTADRLGCLLLTIFSVMMEGGSLAMSTGFGPVRSSCMHKCILHLVLRFLWCTYIQVIRTAIIHSGTKFSK